MKLYRGIKASEFSLLTPAIAKTLESTWKQILRERSRGNLRYPERHNEKILEAAKLGRLQRQHFTDNREIALAYAKANGGMLVEIDVPVAQVLKNFTLEFQNFSQRKKNFEVVYVVDSSSLSKNSRRWKLKTHSLRANNFD